MRRLQGLALVLPLVLFTTGCYHQVVRTGATPSTQVIERPWTATYFFGLVPASTINTAAECPNGVAVVETQQTFPNGLLGVLTLGIYTPQTVRITCATGQAALLRSRGVGLQVGATRSERIAAVREAIELTATTGDRVFLHFDRQAR